VRILAVRIVNLGGGKIGGTAGATIAGLSREAGALPAGS
jgi:hypothetical protein